MIVVAGESLVDLLVDETGEVVAHPGGGPFNVARGLARLGAPCAFLGAISTDPFGAALRRALDADGVDLRHVVTSELPTTLAVAQLNGGAASYRFHAQATAAPALTGRDVVGALSPAPVALHVGTLGLVLEPIAPVLERLVRRAPAETLVMVDPNCRPRAIARESAYRARLRRVMRRADVVKVSTEDLAYLAPDVPLESAARDLLHRGVRCVLVTDGANPVRVFTPAGDRELPAVPAAVVDTVGAGDAFCAGFLARWTSRGRGRDALRDEVLVEDAAAFAMLVAAITCERSGADPPRLEEIARVPRRPDGVRA
jgi:fructokinase